MYRFLPLWLEAMQKHDFLSRYNLTEESLASLDLTWEGLTAMDDAYSAIKPELESVGRYVVDALLKCRDVHSITFRLKDNEHLLEKVVRKRRQDPDRLIDVKTFRNEVTDLVGIRALHLFKEDWLPVHEYIRDTWRLMEKPLAYVRAGDSDTIIDYYRENDCEVREHPFGYRSVHYGIESCPNLHCYQVEIQVRTVFEEAWGEIDHVVRYPYDTENDLLVRLSSILNRLSANADELGSYMRYLKRKTDLTEKRYADTLRERNETVTSLQEKIDRLEVDTATKAELSTGLTEITRDRSEELTLREEFPALGRFFESDLFQGIAERVESIISSPEFSTIDLSGADMAMLSRAKTDLVRLLKNPRFVELLEADGLEGFPFPGAHPDLRSLLDTGKNGPGQS